MTTVEPISATPATVPVRADALVLYGITGGLTHPGPSRG